MWYSLIGREKFDKHYGSAEALLTYRCPDCDGVSSLFGGHPGCPLEEHPFVTKLCSNPEENNFQYENDSAKAASERLQEYIYKANMKKSVWAVEDKKNTEKKTVTKSNGAAAARVTESDSSSTADNFTSNYLSLLSQTAEMLTEVQQQLAEEVTVQEQQQNPGSITSTN